MCDSRDNRLRISFLLPLLLCLAQWSWAEHIFGGDFNMIASNRQGYYRLNLNVYADSTTLKTGNNDYSVRIYIFRNSDDFRMGTFVLPQNKTTSIVYENRTCAGQQELRTLTITYSAEVFLDPTRYIHPEGYYVVWERCCRTDGTTNLTNNGKFVGMAFMLEFPAITPNGKYVKNSSPVFNPPNGDYICLNRRFTMNMGATDADGDELRYSLVTPLQGHTTNTVVMGTGQSYTSYPEVTWASGYNADNMIPGKPALKIDSRTGTISVVATQLGLFVFTVLVEEYRNKERIGSVRRDFQLKVIDCSGAPPPIPIVYSVRNTALPATTVDVCTGEELALNFKQELNVNYQWKKNGINIPEEITNSLKVKEIGDYQVVASYAKKCALDTVSQIVKVIKGKSPAATLLPKDSVGICNDHSATLTATNASTFGYTWYKDGVLMPNQTRNTLTTKAIGTYMVAVKDAAFRCATYDTVVVSRLENPTMPTLTASKIWLCKNDSIRLSAEGVKDASIEWSLNDKVFALKKGNTIYAPQEGTYKATAIRNGCKTESDALKITLVRDDSVLFDSLQPICYNDTARIALKATPPNGKFIGAGVENNRVSVKTAGVGTHTIEYQTIINGCTVGQKRTLTIKDIPHISLPTSMVQPMNSSVQIAATADNPAAYEYHWLPPLDLSDNYILNPTATLKQSTTYTLLATNTEGCFVKKQIRIVVVNLLYPADAFTPNGDSVNEIWLIGNIENYPEAEVFVYNRWGEVIYYDKEGYKKPWNGTYQGKLVETGIYTYLILPHAELNAIAPIKGSVFVLR